MVPLGLGRAPTRPPGRRGSSSLRAAASLLGLIAVVSLGCADIKPSEATLRLADQFYAAIGVQDYEAALRLCGRKMLAESPPEVVIPRLMESRRDFGPLLSRRQASIGMTHYRIPELRGTVTMFYFECVYRNAHTREVLKVFEPDGGERLEVQGYQFDVTSRKGTP